MHAAIVDAAMAQIGVPFRSHGRMPGVALDCVGLVSHCLNEAGKKIVPPHDYTLRGNFSDRLSAFFESNGLVRAAITDVQPGDVGVVLCVPRQYHLLVRAEQGWIHAHAGLGRVVHMPDPSPWDLAQLWRLKGD